MLNDLRLSSEALNRPATTGDFVEYDAYFKLFTEAMKYKLRVNSHKGFIGDVPPDRLMAFLEKEVEEAKEAIARGNHVETLLECADIANFALGILISIVKGTVSHGVREGMARSGIPATMVDRTHTTPAKRGRA